MINAIQIALSGLEAASKKVQASASNIANSRTQGALDPADGPSPYSELTTTQTANPAGGVESEIVTTNKPFVPSYDPSSPFANSEGLVGAPSSNLAGDIVNLQIASTSYKANLKTIQVASDLQKDLLNIVNRKV